MITTNEHWDAKNALLGKRPIYVFAIGGQATVYTTHDLVTMGITGTLPAYSAWLKTPVGASQSIDVLNGTSSIGELECEVVDQAGALRGLIGGNDLEGCSATLSIGYPGIAYSEFVALHTYQIYKVTPSRTYTSWLFRSRDRQLAEKRTIYVNPQNGSNIRDSNPWFLQGTPAEIFQAIYLCGLGRSDAELDRTGLIALDSAAEGLYQTVRPFLCQMSEAFEAKSFIETEICKVSGSYPTVDNLGRLGLKGFRAPAAGPAAVFTFTNANMMVLPEIDRMEVVNEIVFRLDHDGSDFRSKVVYVEATSLSTYGRGSQHVIESKGLRSQLGAQWWCEEVASRLFSRFAGTPTGLRGGPPVYSIEAFLLSLPVLVGDYVYVTHPLMPDVTTGALGVTQRVMEVIDREPDFGTGKMKYKLLDTGLTGLAAAHLWASSSRNFIIESSEIY